ncbi:MAG: ParB/RepB/Spo0J family partition protein [Candidatus Omnitrophota bacterium]|jgi:ParB family chromosome partitioning protein
MENTTDRKALGKGINALIPQKESIHEEKIIFLAIDQIKPNPYQPREDFEPQSLEELTQSIKEKGVIQPILVRQRGEQYELIAGERRFRAASALNLKEIPVIVKNVDDRDSLELSLIENIQRQNLNPVEEARAYHYLIEKYQLTQDEVSDVLGKSRATVANILRLLKLPIEIQDEIKKGRISFAHGRALLEVADVNRQRRLVQDIIAKSLSVRELESMIKTNRPRKAKILPTAQASEPYVVALEERLQQFLATKIRITRKKKRGHILIEFYSQEDLERIIHTIQGAGK